MKLIIPDCVAFYTASKCCVYDAATLPDFPFYEEKDHGPSPDLLRLRALQASLDHESLTKKKSLLIVVPDTWLAISEHQLDHRFSKAVAPLAALAFAVETTFSPPESIYFFYQITERSKQSFHMNLVACSQEFMQALCRPFSDQVRRCGVVSQQQWLALSTKPLGLVRLFQQRLEIYQPDKIQQQSQRRRWSALVFFSLCLNLAFIAYWYHLDQNLISLNDQSSVLQEQQIRLPEVTNPFVLDVLKKIRSLPSGVRIERFQGNDQVANLHLTGYAVELERLFQAWRESAPNWQWQSDLPQSLEVSGSQEEVIDANFIISQT